MWLLKPVYLPPCQHGAVVQAMCTAINKTIDAGLGPNGFDNVSNNTVDIVGISSANYIALIFVLIKNPPTIKPMTNLVACHFCQR